MFQPELPTKEYMLGNCQGTSIVDIYKVLISKSFINNRGKHLNPFKISQFRHIICE